MVEENNIIKVPCYVDGKFVFNENSKNLIYDFEGKPCVETHMASYWTQQAAIETATFTQTKLADMHINKIVKTLEKTMDYYFVSDEKYETISRLSGSQFTFVKGSINFLKDWCKKLHLFVDTIFGTDKDILYRSTSPIISTIPSNSEEESLYVFAQAMLSKNALIVRPSTKSASSYASIEFVRAWNQAIDSLNDPELEILRGAISVVNTPRDVAISNMYLDDWNYILFGGDETLKKIKNDIAANNSTPRKIVAYGTGLCTTVLLEDANLQNHIKDISESICVNIGNECISTDIIYAHKDIYEEFIMKLSKEIEKLKSGSPFEEGSIGLVNESNHTFIEIQLKQRARHQHLKKEDNKLHTSMVTIHKYDSAMEYPGPVVSVRMFEDIGELHDLLRRDLKDNGKKKSLVCSVFTESKEKYKKTLQMLNAYNIRHNVPTHNFDPFLPHQGIYLLKELVETIYLENKSGETS